MKRVPLTRKAPLNRGKRLNAVSTKNKKPFQDATMQAAYRQANVRCELTPWFKVHFPEWKIVLPQLDLHHLRRPGKVDVWPNMIRVCRSIHDMDEVHPDEMLVVCLWHKWRKQGLDWNLKQLDACGIGTVSGHLSRSQPRIAAFVGMWEELTAAVSDKGE